jgi:hypothetical protein
MMERNFYNDDFEELIRQKTGQYKMYPSDKVWKAIYGSLHTRRRRFVTGMTIMIGAILIFAGRELLIPSKHAETARKAVVADLPKNDDGSGISSSLQDLTRSGQLQPLAEIVRGKGGSRQNGTKDDQASGISPFVLLTNPVFNEAALPPPLPSESDGSQDATVREETVAQRQPTLPGSSRISYDALESSLMLSIADHSPRLHTMSADDMEKIQRMQTDAEREDRKQFNWLQEFALQQLSPISQHRLNWQVYVSPTVNYRTLSGPDYAPIKPTIPNVPVALIHFGNINNYVDHTPAIGYNIGTSLIYRITRNISFKAGLQFNYSSYYIRAYASGRQPATLTLSSYYGYITDSLSSTIGNFGGNYRQDLQNKYYTLSAPVGLELRVIGNGRLQLHIGGTLEPTYLLNTNSYLLTNDYTKYIKEPSLYRRWNLNGGLEAFFSYQAGGLRWQIGPQFRYQLYSSYKNQYPVRENLIGYGIKVGISKALR